MRLVGDENVDRQIVERLRQDDHEVWYVAEMDPGINDQDVLDLTNNEGAILLTADKDFGELVFRQRLVNPGIILLRLSGLPSTVKVKRVLQALRTHGEAMREAFVVITHRAIRIRLPRN